jgi:hypothetical protein
MSLFALPFPLVMSHATPFKSYRTETADAASVALTPPASPTPNTSTPPTSTPNTPTPTSSTPNTPTPPTSTPNTSRPTSTGQKSTRGRGTGIRAKKKDTPSLWPALLSTATTSANSNVDAAEFDDSDIDVAVDLGVQPIGDGASYFADPESYAMFNKPASHVDQHVPHSTTTATILASHSEATVPSGSTNNTTSTTTTPSLHSPFRVAASLLGTYTLLGCDLFLHRAAKRDTPRLPSNEFCNAQSNTIDLIHEGNVKRGIEFEEKLLCALEARCHVLDLDTKSAATRRGCCNYTALDNKVDQPHIDDVACGSSSSSSSSDRKCAFEQLARVESNSLFDAVEKHFDVVPSIDTLYVYQAVLHDIDGAFVVELGLQPSQVEIALAKPDFLRICKQHNDDGMHYTVTIIDAKSSKKLKSSHQVQVALYALLLEHLIRKYNKSTSWQVDNTGEIWLPATLAASAQLRTGSKQQTHVLQAIGVQCESLSLDLAKPFVSRFFATKAHHVLDTSVVEPQKAGIEWFLSPTCAGCQYVRDCKSYALQHQDVNALPYMSRADRRWAKIQVAQHASQQPAAAASATATVATSDIEELYRMIQPGGALDTADSSQRLRAEQALSLPALQLFRTSGQQHSSRTVATAVARGKATTAVPVSEHVAVYLTMHLDPNTQQPCFAAIRVLPRNRAPQFYAYYSDATGRSNSATTAPQGNCVALQLVQTLCSIIRLYSCSTQTVQFYTWNAMERDTVIQAVLQVLLTAEQQQEQQQQQQQSEQQQQQSESVVGNIHNASLMEMATDCLLVLCNSPLVVLAPRLASSDQHSSLDSRMVKSSWQKVLTSMRVRYLARDSVLILEIRYLAASIELYADSPLFRPLSAAVLSTQHRRLGDHVLEVAFGELADLSTTTSTGGSQAIAASSDVDQRLQALSEAQLKSLQASLKKTLTEATDNRLKRTGKASPRVATILDAIKALVVLRSPGFYSLAECVEHLIDNSSAQATLPFTNRQFLNDSYLLWLWNTEQYGSLCRSLEARTIVWARILATLRHDRFAPRLAGSPTGSVLISSASTCRVSNDHAYTNAILGKLAFMAQYERTVAVQELVTERIEAKRTVRLTYHDQLECSGTDTYRLRFRVVDGHEFLRESDRFMADYIMVQAMDTQHSAVAMGMDCQFADLLYANLVVSRLPYYSRPKDVCTLQAVLMLEREREREREHSCQQLGANNWFCV